MTIRKYISRLVFAGILFTAFSALVKAQDGCPCCTENHKQFDFWVGEWIVYDTAGNKVEKIKSLNWKMIVY